MIRPSEPPHSRVGFQVPIALKRMVQFADWSGWEIRLVDYPPY
jgi:hypothetical protein